MKWPVMIRYCDGVSGLGQYRLLLPAMISQSISVILRSPKSQLQSLFFFYIASMLFKKHAHSHRPHTSCQTVQLLMQLTAAVSGKETEEKIDMGLYL